MGEGHPKKNIEGEMRDVGAKVDRLKVPNHTDYWDDPWLFTRELITLKEQTDESVDAHLEGIYIDLMDEIPYLISQGGYPLEDCEVLMHGRWNPDGPGDGFRHTFTFQVEVTLDFKMPYPNDNVNPS